MRIVALLILALWGLRSDVHAAQEGAAFLEPKDQAAEIALPAAFSWTPVEGAITYYLYVGTAKGLKDLVDTGEIPVTTYKVPYLPPGRTLYARVSTKLQDGRWVAQDVTFTVGGKPVATFLHPTDGAAKVNLNEPYRWTEVPGAKAYVLTVGTKPGANDLLDTGEIQKSSYVGPLLPPGQTFYARVSTKRGDGSWVTDDVRFTSARKAVATFVYPSDGSVHVDLKRPFEWTAVPGAARFVLQIGTMPGGNDVLDTGERRGTTYTVRSLPAGKVLFARIKTKFKTREKGLGKSQWANSGVRFRLDDSVMVPEMIFPQNGDSAIDTSRPFQWSSVELARGYRLEIGTRAGAHDISDSQEISVTRRFLYDLPAGQVLHGRVSANVGGHWQSRDFIFSAGQASAPEPYWIESAIWATGVVREMADPGNLPFGWTRLWRATQARGFMFAYCSEYATALHFILEDMDMRAQTRTRDVYFDDRDGHTLMEMSQGEGKGWLILDPTFGLTIKRASDGQWATTEDMSEVARSGKVADVAYQFTSSFGDEILRGYYIEYTKLYLKPNDPRPAGSQ